MCEDWLRTREHPINGFGEAADTLWKLPGIWEVCERNERKPKPHPMYQYCLSGDCLNRNAKMLCAMPCGDKSQVWKAREMALNIRYGNGAAIVVRGWESQPHGEGRQVIRLITNGGMRNADSWNGIINTKAKVQTRWTLCVWPYLQELLQWGFLYAGISKNPCKTR